MKMLPKMHKKKITHKKHRRENIKKKKKEKISKDIKYPSTESG